MTSPLTPDEWKLLHQTMDRVDAARAKVPVAPPNLERIKHTALETYRSQGIEVAEKDLEHALAAAQSVPAPSSSLPSTTPWHRRCLGWARHLGLITSGPWVEKPSVPPGGFASRAWSNSKNFLGRLAGHSPRDDRTLFETIDRSLGFQRTRLKKFNQGIIGSAAVVVALGLATLLTGLPWWVAAVPRGVVLGWCWLHRWDTQEKIDQLTEARTALSNRDWEHPRLAEVFSALGLKLLGSLKPLSAYDPQWKALGEACWPHKELRNRWQKWSHDPSLRHGDMALLKNMTNLFAKHPSLAIHAEWNKLKNRFRG